MANYSTYEEDDQPIYEVGTEGNVEVTVHYEPTFNWTDLLPKLEDGYE